MRIISGAMKGKRLLTPEGLHTRPTTDRVKESIFNVIQWDIEGRNVLDLFGGSGQLGLEALSRGAASCVFVEGDKHAQKVLEANIKACGSGIQAKLVKGDAFSFLQQQKSRAFQLIFLDPPYGGAILNQALQEICRIDILSEGGIIVCESAEIDEIKPLSAPYCILRQYHYGHTKITTVGREVRHENSGDSGQL